MEKWQFQQRQSLPLLAKNIHTDKVIIQWYEYHEGNVYISYSGGKDSDVLLHKVRSLFPNTPAVFCDTGLEYPEIRDHVKTIDNVIWLKPDILFPQVIKNYGFPFPTKEQAQYIREARHTKSEKLRNLRLNGRPGDKKRNGAISKCWLSLVDADFEVSEKCCFHLKKKPFITFEKQTGLKPFLGTTGDESGLRMQEYLQTGCNAFDLKRPVSRPLSIWLMSDIWDQIHNDNINYCSIYDKGETQTGCMFCLFGIHLEPSPNRFERMKIHHPKQYDYCIYELNSKQVLDKYGIPY